MKELQRCATVKHAAAFVAEVAQPTPRALRRSRTEATGVLASSKSSVVETRLSPRLTPAWLALPSRCDDDFADVQLLRETRQHSATTVAPATRPKSPAQVQGSAARRYKYLDTEIWVQALQTLAILLPNTVVCVLYAWFVNWLYTLGNIFSQRSAAHQSTFEFLTGLALLGHAGIYAGTICMHTHVLLPLQFVQCTRSGQQVRTTFLFCLRRLVAHTLHTFVISVALLVVALWVCASGAPHVKRLRPEYYVCALFVHVVNAAITVGVRAIYRLETAQGQARYRRAQRPPSRSRAARAFVRAFVQTSPKLLICTVAGVYIQLASRYQVTTTTSFAVYTLGSMLAKLAVKEVAKRGIVKLRVQDPRSIFVAAGLPTVIIDTQVRVMLQRTQSTNTTIVWSLGMAVCEVAMRLAAVLYTKRTIRRKTLAVRQGDAASSSRRLSSAVAPDKLVPPKSVSAQPAAPLTAADSSTATAAIDKGDELATWTEQILTFQVAESYASMSAEYIAIGCAASIVFFFGHHHKYALSSERESAAAVADAGASSSPLLGRGYTLGMQVLLEVAVDYFSCVLELRNGVDFATIRTYRGFLAVLFASIAALNMHICSLIYVAND